MMDDFRGDPFEWLRVDVFALVLSLLDVASLARSVSVSTKWKSVAESDTLWAKHFRELWKHKFTLRTSFLHQIEPRITAYCLSLEEGRRIRITADDLCSYTWNFWYKREAGNYWVNCDPYWLGLHPMRRYFHRDGYVSADPDDPLWGGHECRWNFTKMDEERSVRINEWPPLKVSRTSCWGWRMENFMVVYETSCWGWRMENFMVVSQTSHPGESSEPGAAVDDRRKF